MSTARKESEVDLLIRITNDMEERLARAIGAGAPPTLFGMIESVEEWMSKSAFNNAHRLRTLRNDLVHGNVPRLADCPKAKRYGMKTRRDVERSYALVKAEIGMSVKRRKRSDSTDKAAPTQSGVAVPLFVAACLVVAGVFMFQFLPV